MWMGKNMLTMNIVGGVKEGEYDGWNGNSLLPRNLAYEYARR